MTLDPRDYDAVLLDLDGTVWSEDFALPGAIELIDALQTRGQRFAFISNNDHPPSRLMRRFAAMGASVDPAIVYTAARAACEHVRGQYSRGTRVFDLAGSAAAELLGDHVELIDDGPCDVVLSASLGHPNAGVDRLQRALRHLLNSAALISFSADRRYPTPDGAEIGGGGVATMLAYAAGVTPTFCGKPERVFFATLCRTLGVEPSRCVIVGDNLESDVAGGRRMGMATILPLTGITTRAHLATLDPAAMPDRVIDDLRALV